MEALNVNAENPRTRLSMNDFCFYAMAGGLKFESFSHDITAAVISDNEIAAMYV